MFVFDEIAALELMRYIYSLYAYVVCAHAFLSVLGFVSFLWVSLCHCLCLLSGNKLYMCVSLYSMLHDHHLQSRPTYHIETSPNSESLILYLCFNRMSIDCMFELQNLIWQAKQQKSEAGRSCMKLQI